MSSGFSPLTASQFGNLTGDEVYKIAWDQKPISPVGLGLASDVLIYIFSPIVTILIGLRIWIRSSRREMGSGWKLEDYLAVAGFLPFLPAEVLGVLSTRYGVGAPDRLLNKFMLVKANELLLLFELIYYASSIITKFAIAFMILRICVAKRYIYIMYAIMIIQGITSGGSMIFLFQNCRPFSAWWNPKAGTCSSENGFFVISYVGTSIQVVTDWTCAIMPFFIVRKLQMARRKKISVVLILGLGVIASFAALMRIASYPYTDTNKYPKDHMVSEARLLLWSQLEVSFSIIACSLPPMRALFKRFYDPSSAGRSGAMSAHLSRDPSSALRSGTQLSSLTPHGKSLATITTDRGKWRMDDDNSSRQHIIRETEVHVESCSDHESTHGYTKSV